MKALKAVLIITILLTASATHAQFKTGNDLVQGWEAVQRADRNQGSEKQIVRDIYKGLQFLDYCLGAIDAVAFFHNLSHGATAGQVQAIVGKYLDAHPEEWNDNGAQLVIRAISEAFPLPGKK